MNLFGGAGERILIDEAGRRVRSLFPQADHIACAEHNGNPLCSGAPSANHRSHKLLRLSRRGYKQTKNRWLVNPDVEKLSPETGSGHCNRRWESWDTIERLSDLGFRFILLTQKVSMA
jgi:hypothetical protein